MLGVHMRVAQVAVFPYLFNGKQKCEEKSAQ